MTRNASFNIGGHALEWIEEPAEFGLRFVGYADEISKRNYSYAYGIDHSGWFSNEDEYSTLRGVVYQLPARSGSPIYVIGYTEFEGRTPLNGNSAALDLHTLYKGEKGGAAEGASYDSDARDAARAADKIAERVAEREREYNEAWRAGSNYAEAGEELSSERKATLELIRDMKAQRARGATPAICNALAGVIKSSLRHIAELKEKRAELVERFNSGWQADIWPAFNDGAGETIIA